MAAVPDVRPSRKSEAKRTAVLRAAVDLFLTNGYERTSMDAVAQHAGVGKQTVYSHFPGKEALFMASVESVRTAPGKDEQRPDLDPNRPRDGLRALGAAVLNAILDPTVAALQRLTISELPHHPQLQEIWRSGAQGTGLMRAVAAYLDDCRQASSLMITDPLRTARQFVFLLATEARTATAYGITPLETTERKRILRETVDLFVAAQSP